MNQRSDTQDGLVASTTAHAQVHSPSSNLCRKHATKTKSSMAVLGRGDELGVRSDGERHSVESFVSSGIIRKDSERRH